MAYSLTFGDVAENHIGNQQIGSICHDGFTKAELLYAKTQFEVKGCTCELVELHKDV
ncbi:unnamed protein product, partial [marine sediment metagenome]